MPLPEQVRRVLPADTAATWETIADLIPSTTYLAGGTALAIYLAHRMSRDLDFFYHSGSLDLDRLARQLAD